MKLFAIIAVALTAFTAQAQCNFGANTWELEERFEAPSGPREFHKGETFHLSKSARLGGLFDYEKQAIAAALGQTAPSPEYLKEFSETDGFLTYFAHAPSGRQFVQVGHFPADNEFGAIFEIKVLPSGTELVGMVSKIEDGNFGDCLF